MVSYAEPQSLAIKSYYARLNIVDGERGQQGGSKPHLFDCLDVSGSFL